MPQSYDMGQTALLPLQRKACSARKIRRLQPGLNPQTWVPEVSMLTTRPLKQLFILFIFREKIWVFLFQTYKILYVSSAFLSRKEIANKSYIICIIKYSLSFPDLKLVNIILTYCSLLSIYFDKTSYSNPFKTLLPTYVQITFSLFCTLIFPQLPLFPKSREINLS
jgi:hypothetical protein